MPDHNIKAPDYLIFPDQPVARRIFRHILQGPKADPPEVYASLMTLLEYLDTEGVHEAIFSGEGYSYIVKWSPNPTKEGSQHGQTPSAIA